MDRKPARRHAPDSLVLLLALLTLPLSGLTAPIPAATQAEGRYIWEALPERAPGPGDSAAMIALGKKLFEERQLSRDGSLSCRSCHDLDRKAGGDGRARARGVGGALGPRNTPTVWNAAFMRVLFWDGRASTLEAQAAGPLLNPIEMGLPSTAEAERRIRAIPGYRPAFEAAFGKGTPIRFDGMTRAIAAYERTLITPDSPYDRFVRGDPNALDATQKRGMALFEATGCVLCHRGPNFSDASAPGGRHPLRLFPAHAGPAEARHPSLRDKGRAGAWRIPSLRNVALTGPWLHNGAVKRLEDVVRIMAESQLARSATLHTWYRPDGTLVKADRRPLGKQDVQDIVAFLHALSSDRLSKASTGPDPGRHH
ncbi:cytochrome c peroxidase [Zoogloea sp.]|uniref:cytochrome-c peroxidase n=1 Tax=Zoogloea sp. TaxID=49181 RepID=UPI001ACED581|nr:cytochrome c peroxidase [Zoogloea sp.]MBN8283824.1 cytochrome-c peroxidase [Zoogloea sp.]